MLELLWLVPALPLAGFLVLALAGAGLPRRAVPWIGAGAVGGSLAAALGVAASFVAAPPPDDAFRQVLWRWWSVEGLAPEVALHLDGLSLVMALVVTGVGFLVHLYSAEYMAGEEDRDLARYFAALNLFVGMMLVLVLASDLLLLYLGWEGVGLCSFLLIGFHRDDPANGRAARKAFVVTRIGDAALALGLFLLFHRLGTLEITDVLAAAAERWSAGDPVATLAAALLLGGAVGKSAQLPLQTWLPDAMAGPTPVSALIHAATMVTAGVYLVARVHPLFELAPAALAATAAIGAATLLLGAFSALAQDDLKRLLAYSTISQIGYMFLALGVGAWTAALFHLVTHAFFKALLFLAAGAVIEATGGEQAMSRLGGLARRLPLVFWTFVAGAAALAGLPLVTAGFYSKELVLVEAFAAEGGAWLWAAGIAGALLTALYAFRAVFLVFLGEASSPVSHRPGRRMTAPLVVLAVLSLVGGFVETPASLGGVELFGHLVAPVLGGGAGGHGHGAAPELALQAVAAAVSLLGLAAAWALFARNRRPVAGLVGERLARLWRGGWGFDALYAALVVRPFVGVCRRNRDDVVDGLYRGLADLAVAGHRLLARTQTGRLGWYAAAVGGGAAALLLLVELLT